METLIKSIAENSLLAALLVINMLAVYKLWQVNQKLHQKNLDIMERVLEMVEEFNRTLERSEQ